MRWRCICLLVGLLVALFHMEAIAFWATEPSSLKELAVAVSHELRDKAGRTQKLYLDKTAVRDAVSGDTSNFSAFLVNELEAAFSAAGFSYSDFMEQADLAVGASYQRDGDSLRVFIKYCPAREPSGCKSLNATLPVAKLPKESFSESLDARISRLVQKTTVGRKGLKVFINPVVERKGRYASEFSDYITTKARTVLVASQLFEVLDEQPVVRSLSNTRGLSAKVKEVKNLETSAALLSGADAVLEGYYLDGGKLVTLALTLKDLKGGVLGSADEGIERSQIPYSTRNNVADALAVVADIPGQVEQRVVKLNTTKGDRFQVYRSGERLQFLIQVARPLYVYLYGINAKNEVALLYPGPGQQATPLVAGKLHTVPADTDSWEIVVEPPYGTDVVKLFAADRPLAVPVIANSVAPLSLSDGERHAARRAVIQRELSQRRAVNGFDLVDYFKGLADRLGVVLYEDSLFVQTKPR